MQIIELLVGITLIVFAILAIESKKIITSVIYLSILSMLSVVSFIFMKAPDVAITEAVIGSGLVTAVFIFTLFSMKKAGDKE
ncbi:sodium:proton antiporter [Marinitoga sp. 1135]|uniref:Putative subunit of the multisubunit Na+/H+ antiporter n=1 Tax=Marinitoga piezophila (strain DSM 14283 / JCM 11233 / KA3) TaxID=443254 RepID=H2J5R9_MARPK|nr:MULTISPECIES: hydrogenase subunit MbhD domain-containing protein [Marinitoga]AEX85055.1 putative subunit of the multisubunit Na+/H+ antiporter [Marinitoga piezophila KA3]APT75563.1 sodium:proton antiporter [Marinitoga sp. 1137]NUU95273.1 sodium:proton antiporter [Marinitoga sp. 1135]NUU97207.1 sodium:proton antiporter [Marinitoga sp. 1138]